MRFEVLDPPRALLQLHHQLGDVIGQRDCLGEPLLLGAHAGELGLQRGDVVVALRQLCFDLRSYSRGESLVHREPGRIINDAPLRDFRLDHLARIGLHAADGATLAELLDPPWR